MTPSRKNCAVIAAAGSRKTQYIINEALAAPTSSRVLITTYTTANCDQIISRICEAKGYVPPNISVLGWFTFLINQAARPYQSAITGKIDYAKSLNFEGKRFRMASRSKPFEYYFDHNADFWRDGVAEFAFYANRLTQGRVTRRLEAIYDRIYIDEFQDLAGYDLDFLDLLFDSNIEVTIVGDPRQQTYATNDHNKNIGYRGEAMRWLNERSAKCEIKRRRDSWRCNQEICDWADALYPDELPTQSRNQRRTGHDGITYLLRSQVPSYVETHNPIILRWDRTDDTLGFLARNMRGTKGCTFDRVLIFLPGTLREYVIREHRDPSTLKPLTLATLYVAVTRARYSVAFVVDAKAAADDQQGLFDVTPYVLPRAS